MHAADALSLGDASRQLALVVCEEDDDGGGGVADGVRPGWGRRRKRLVLTKEDGVVRTACGSVPAAARPRTR